MTRPKNVDEYIAGQPAETAKRLTQIRKIVRQAAPDATEKISYGMPYYGLNGRLLYFMAHTHHIGFYPMKSAVARFEEELKDYRTSKGTVQFPYDNPLPLELIRKIVVFRAQENRNKNS